VSAPHVIRPKLQPTPTTELGLGAPHSKKPLPAVGGSSFFSQMCRCFGWCEWESGRALSARSEWARTRIAQLSA